MYRTLTIERLGQRGEGVAQGDSGPVYVPYALAGDDIRADVDGERGTLIEIITPSPRRIEPFCKYYSHCGGCAVQALAPDDYRDWKRELVVSALRHSGIEVEVAALIDAHGEGRRRATFHARVRRDGLDRPHIACGFMRARAHDIIDIDACPILAPSMLGAPAVARAIATALAGLDKPLDIVVFATHEGLDVDFRGTGALDEAARRAVIRVAGECDLARLSNHGEIVIERRTPTLQMGRALLAPPPGAFLQATEAGEETLARLVGEAIARYAPKAKRIADLFSGVGTFALRLTERAAVHAVETDVAALAALAKAAHLAQGLKAVSTEARDLFRRPLAEDELAKLDAVVFDPPRAGALEQARALAASEVGLVVAVSCNVQTFARDARVLIDGGYKLESVTPVDQFRHSPHVEMVAAFTKAKPPGARRRLLG